MFAKSWPRPISTTLEDCKSPDACLEGTNQGAADLVHASTSGLFAGVRARQVADRSVG
jgi:hypothetical protein